MILDILAPMRAATDVSVPPNGEAFRLKRGNKWPKAGAVLRLVGYKYVGGPGQCYPQQCGTDVISCAGIYKIAHSRGPHWVESSLSALL